MSPASDPTGPTAGQRAVYGIFGHPVEHSRSPAMHNAAFAATGIHAVYVAFPVRPQDLSTAVAGVRALGIQGFNVTLPHKAAIMDLLDAVEPGAAAIGAVNTVHREGDRLIGSNTDAGGLARSLVEADVALQGASVVVIGAGGAARAAVVGLSAAGAVGVTVVARRPAQAQALVRDLSGAVGATTLRGSGMTGLADRLTDCDLLVQATSATLGDQAAAAAFAESLPMDALPTRAVVTDLVYEPRVTTVLARARERGLAIVDGSGMLVHQGALAFERWTGQVAPLPVMTEAFWRR